MHVQDLDPEIPWIDMQTQSVKLRVGNNDALFSTVGVLELLLVVAK
jgi:hypothetical protein